MNRITALAFAAMSGAFFNQALSKVQIAFIDQPEAKQAFAALLLVAAGTAGASLASSKNFFRDKGE